MASPSFIKFLKGLEGLILLCFLHATGAQYNCIQTGQCTCLFNDPDVTLVDLSKIGLNGKPLFPFDKYGSLGGFSYAFNPCFQFTLSTSCTNVVGCQRYDESGETYAIGDPTPTSWTTLNNDITIKYESTPRVSEITYKCDAAAKTPSLTYTGADTSPYKMQVTTCLVCVPAVDGCLGGGGGGGGGDITVGGILCIVFTLLVLFYVVGGVLFQVFARGATGKEMIPNYAFWADFPILVKDGFMLMISPCRKEGYSDIDK